MDTVKNLDDMKSDFRAFKYLWIIAFLCMLFLYFRLETRTRWVERYKDQGLVLVPLKEFVELRKAVIEMKEEEEAQQNEPPAGGSKP